MITFKTETEGFETYRVCEIEENEALDTVGIGMLRNNQIKGLASLAYSRMNDKRALRYNVSSRISLQQFFMGQVDKKRFLTVLRNIVAAVDVLTDYMMDKDQLITEKAEIYVNVGTLDVEMLYCPLLKEKKELDLTTFVKSLITETEFDKNDGEYVAELINFLNRPGGFAPAELKEYIDIQLGKQPVRKPARTPMQMIAEPQNTTNFTPKGIPSNTTMFTPSGFDAPVSGNLGGANSFGAAPMQSAPAAQPQSMPMNQPFAVPGMAGNAATPAADASKKKKFSLFGSKKKKGADAEAVAKPDKKAEKKKAAKSSKKTKDYVTPEGIVIPGVQDKGGNLPTPPKPAGAAIKQDPSTFANMYAQQPQQPVQPQQPAQPYVVQASLPQQPMFASQPMAQPVMQPQQSAPQQTFVPQQPVQPKQPMFNAQPQQPSYSTAMNTVLSKGPETTVLGNQGFSGETTVLNAGYNTMEKMRRPYLIRKRTNQKIDISKDIFRIGKEQSYVDYFVNDNTAISRSHADIVKRGNEYFIIDNNSLNHTYVNGEQIQSQVPTPLKDFDTVTLADEFFEYRL